MSVPGSGNLLFLARYLSPKSLTHEIKYNSFWLYYFRQAYPSGPFALRFTVPTAVARATHYRYNFYLNHCKIVQISERVHVAKHPTPYLPALARRHEQRAAPAPLATPHPSHLQHVTGGGGAIGGAGGSVYHLAAPLINRWLSQEGRLF